MLVDRPIGRSVYFSYFGDARNMPPGSQLRCGDSVRLQTRTAILTVKIIAVTDTGEYGGLVEEVEHESVEDRCSSKELERFKAGISMEFEERHVWSCMRGDN